MHFLINVNNVSFSYGTKSVLKNVSFQVNEGDYIFVVGANGSGKTTLIKLLLGVLTPNDGEIEHENLNFGYVPQINKEKNVPLSVYDVIAFGFKRRNLFLSSNQKQQIKIIAEKMEIVKLLYTKFENLSGGQKQRVYIARALVDDPDILIFDEPTTGLDFDSLMDFKELLGKLQNSNKTIIHITHDNDEIFMNPKCRILKIKGGQCKEVFFDD